MTQEERWAAPIGTVIAISIVIAAVSPRTYAFTFPLVSILLIGTLLYRFDLSPGKASTEAFKVPHLRFALLTAGAFFGFGIVSSLWSADPAHALEKSSIITLAATLVTIAILVLRDAPDKFKRRLAEGVFVGLAIAAAFAAFELLTGQWTKISVINLLGFKPGEINPRQTDDLGGPPARRAQPLRHDPIHVADRTDGIRGRLRLSSERPLESALSRGHPHLCDGTCRGPTVREPDVQACHPYCKRRLAHRHVITAMGASGCSLSGGLAPAC